MRRTLRKIGNSHGVLVPASFLAACELGGELEMRLEGNRIVIELVSTSRAGWFDNFQSDADEYAWNEMDDSGKESDDWER